MFPVETTPRRRFKAVRKAGTGQGVRLHPRGGGGPLKQVTWKGGAEGDDGWGTPERERPARRPCSRRGAGPRPAAETRGQGRGPAKDAGRSQEHERPGQNQEAWSGEGVRAHG